MWSQFVGTLAPYDVVTPATADDNNQSSKSKDEK